MASKPLRFHAQAKQEYLTALLSHRKHGIESGAQLQPSILKAPLVWLASEPKLAKDQGDNGRTG